MTDPSLFLPVDFEYNGHHKRDMGLGKMFSLRRKFQPN